MCWKQIKSVKRARVVTNYFVNFVFVFTLAFYYFQFSEGHKRQGIYVTHAQSMQQRFPLSVIYRKRKSSKV